MLFDLFSGSVDDGKVKMGIYRGCSVTGKVLSGRQDAGLFKPLRVGFCIFDHLFGLI